ncbi:hypothetical protein [Roseovarius arcticus]|uniref:hypothetical protein n=1 Tax=Roseovarius arcticus TaxID=2547404 RepID=UPI001110CD28|nr:hypothetical protein [Roseovarius arcticus]
MSLSDDSIHSYEVREIVASFHDADLFETAVQTLEDRGIKRGAINMMASHDAVKRKLHHHFKTASDVSKDDDLPQPIYEDRQEIENDKRLAVGMPVYIGGASAGLAVVATGGTLAFAALIAAAGAAVGAGIGGLIAHAIGEHHAHLLAKQLKKGALLVLVEVSDEEEEMVIDVLKQAGGADVTAHTLTRYEVFDRNVLPMFDPYGWLGF